jgi:hypothetical protein
MVAKRRCWRQANIAQNTDRITAATDAIEAISGSAATDAIKVASGSIELITRSSYPEEVLGRTVQVADFSTYVDVDQMCRSPAMARFIANRRLRWFGQFFKSDYREQLLGRAKIIRHSEGAEPGMDWRGTVVSTNFSVETFQIRVSSQGVVLGWSRPDFCGRLRLFLSCKRARHLPHICEVQIVPACKRDLEVAHQADQWVVRTTRAV